MPVKHRLGTNSPPSRRRVAFLISSHSPLRRYNYSYPLSERRPERNRIELKWEIPTRMLTRFGQVGSVALENLLLVGMPWLHLKVF